jgi:bla regulator protein blaR1
MIPAYLLLLANHVWQSTLCAAGVWLLTLALRKNRAAVRYWLWFAASVKFLIPFSALAKAGSEFAWRTAPATAPPHWSLAIESVGQPFGAAAKAAALQSPAALPATHAALIPAILLVVWICGFAATIAYWLRCWLKVRSARRAAAPLPIDAPIPVMSSPARTGPGVVGILRPVLLLPEGMAERLTAAQTDAIVAHEICHVRRRDNLTAAIHMAVEAIFWFHPLAWWIGARLMEERERACDEGVLQAGVEAREYAEGILNVCKFSIESSLACVSGVTGSNLKQRIVRIMSPGLAAKLGAGRKLLLIAAGVAAVAGPIVFGVVNAPRVRAQEPPANDATLPSFASVSIRTSTSENKMVRMMINPQGFTARGITAKALIEFAYNIKSDNQLSGGPDWITSAKFDIDANGPDSAPAEPSKIDPGQQSSQVRLMAQSMLAERFGLKVSSVTKVLPAYALLVADGGPKLTPSMDQPLQPPQGFATAGTTVTGKMQGFRGMQVGNGEFNANNAPMSLLADTLSHAVGAVVVDQTGLTGNYDFSLHWTPGPNDSLKDLNGDAPAGEAAPADSSGTSILEAVQDQLGLKLEPQQRPVNTIVIDSIEQPTGN